MFGIGGSELVVILLVALLVFGPNRIPELARAISAGYAELTKLKRQVGDTVSELRQEIDIQAGIQDEFFQALRPPTGARIAAEAARPRPAASPAKPPEGGGRTASAPSPAPVKRAAMTDVDDYLAPAASGNQHAVVASAADDYLSGERHE